MTCVSCSQPGRSFASVAKLKKAFRESVDDYLAFCDARGETPDRPFSGQFITRIPPELHRRVNVAAALSGKSLNAWVADQLQAAVSGAGASKTTVGNKGGIGKLT